MVIVWMPVLALYSFDLQAFQSLGKHWKKGDKFHYMYKYREIGGIIME